MKKSKRKNEKLDLLYYAKKASGRSYSPYSKMSVGCALKSGENIYTGANIENSSYGTSVCAERVALYKAVLAGERKFDEIAVYSEEVEPNICGICLQVLSEFFSGREKVLVATSEKVKEYSFNILYPVKFGTNLK